MTKNHQKNDKNYKKVVTIIYIHIYIFIYMFNKGETIVVLIQT